MNSPRAQRALNSSRRIKEYSRPFTSPGRGARVVYETDKWSCRSFWSRALTSVDLPAPEGATMMNTLPVMLPALMRKNGGEDKVENPNANRGAGNFPNGLPDLRRKTRAFFSRLAQGASAKTVCTIRRARSDTGKITEKCSRCRRIARALTQGGIAGWIVERKAHPAKIGEGCKLRITEPHWPDAMIAGGQMR